MLVKVCHAGLLQRGSGDEPPPLSPHHHQKKASKIIHTLVNWLHGDGSSPSYETMDDHQEHHGTACHREKIKGGSVPVYVGHGNPERFLVKLKLINHPLFRKLLELTEEELGFCDNCRLVVPCDAHVFQRVIARIDAEESGRKLRPAEEELLGLFDSIPGSS
ncbi:auxin-responsive protein SAUR32-like [Selaginella moellendorffii]|uniref:auxin-responsive protein SAUR32-like n=1 Tax=Selaginella moellendorffii TaxID=88036 RepID=UPI000D1C46C7|nr:auxin-responsive protein SAUR32-like [Selaginella moellendorffii]|eukprot:XP_024516096.1 auxin-responsive protein SAUR32-like [Selaginella moellendorffii]